jgi:hypothetical protein
MNIKVNINQNNSYNPISKMQAEYLENKIKAVLKTIKHLKV